MFLSVSPPIHVGLHLLRVRTLLLGGSFLHSTYYDRRSVTSSVGVVEVVMVNGDKGVWSL